ncbi:MAG: alkaline phosphatase family protein [Lacipirellulaceae bacterium]
MPDRVILLSVPALRERDLARMPHLRAMVETGDFATLVPSFPGVTCAVQANMTTGATPSEHGVVANGLFHRKAGRLEMWTSWADAVQRPRVWDRLAQHDPELTSAVWFPLLAKGCAAEWVCTPAPIHNPDGSESLWCYTKPQSMYGELRDTLGHFPLQHFWGPLAGIAGTRWIVSSFLWMAERERPAFSYVYLPHLDYASQKRGPDSPEAHEACSELDDEVARLRAGVAALWPGERVLWLVASEYAVTLVSRVVYPNRVLREAGLTVTTLDGDGRELLDLAASPAWALADHQHAHVYVRDSDAAVTGRVADLFRGRPGVAQLLDRDEQRRLGLEHERSGDLVLVAEADSWFAYYYWLDDAHAPLFARTIDIHRKPGFDPVEMEFDRALFAEHGGGIPLDATLTRGSHGAPAWDGAQRGVLLASEPSVFVERTLADVDVFETVLRQFGI